MSVQYIISIIGLILAGATSTIGVYISLERKVTINDIKIKQLEKDVEYLKEESKEHKIAIQNTLIEIQKSIHSIELKFEQLKK